MRKRISTTTRKKFTNSIRDIMSDLSRPIEVFKTPIKHECFNCYYDKLTNSSTNTCKWTLAEALQKQNEYAQSGGIGVKYKYFSTGRCPICKGKGYLETLRKAWVKCKITWDPKADTEFISDPAGVSGNTSVELKTDPKYINLFTDCTHMFVDDIKCVLSKPPIIRGIGEASLLIILAFTPDKVTTPVEGGGKIYE